MTTTTRQLPWDAMGSQLSSSAATVDQALKESGLDYQVSVWHAIAENPEGGAQLRAPLHQTVTRPMPDGTEKVLAFTRKRYTPIQNADAFKVADLMVDKYGAKITAAADFRNGDRSILVVQLPDSIELQGRGGVDPVTLNLMVVNDHAGNAALSLALTPLRIACTNVLPAAMKGAERVWKISHTPRAQARLDLAAEAIERSLVYREAFQAQAQRMLDQDMVDAEFRKMIQRLYPVAKDATGVKVERTQALHATLQDMWHTSPTIENVRGTRWAGYNVVTEYLDHMRPVRAEDAGVARAEGALDGPYVRQKAALWSMFASA